MSTLPIASAQTIQTYASVIELFNLKIEGNEKGGGWDFFGREAGYCLEEGFGPWRSLSAFLVGWRLFFNEFPFRFVKTS